MFSFQVIIAQMIPCVDCYCSRTCERSLPLVLALHVPRYFVRIPNTDPPLTASEFQVTQVQACLSFFFLLLKGRGGVKITLFLAGIRCREGGYDCIKKNPHCNTRETESIGTDRDRDRDLACVSQKTRKLLGPEDFSGLFSGEFLGSRKAFLNAPENTPDSHPSFSGCFLGFAARA